MKATIVVFLIALSLVPEQSHSCRNTAINPGGDCICFDDIAGYLFCNPGATCTVGAPCGVAGCGCFLAGTLVETDAGPMRIEEVRIGDRVLSVSKEGAFRYNTVSGVYGVVDNAYYVINGAIRVTGAHPFRVESREESVTSPSESRGWQKAQDLRAGDVLFGKDGVRIVVETVVRVNSVVRAYNLEVDGDHTFFADGVLAGC